MSESLPYRRSAGVALINANGDVFVGRRAKERETPTLAGHEWQMPQGGIDEGESPLAAAKRELYEETNVRSAMLMAEAPQWFSYDLPTEARGRWRGRYRGQTQKWFLFRFEGPEAEIDIDSPAEGQAHRRIPGMALGALGEAARPRRAVQARRLREGRRGLRPARPGAEEARTRGNSAEPPAASFPPGRPCRGAGPCGGNGDPAFTGMTAKPSALRPKAAGSRTSDRASVPRRFPAPRSPSFPGACAGFCARKSRA